MNIPLSVIFKTVLLSIIVVIFSISSQAQELVNDEGDALDYANDNGVSLDEAQYRLDIQTEIGELDNILLLDTRLDYAGMYIQHQPVYRIYVLFKNQKGKGNKVNAGEIQRRLAKTSWRSFVKIRKTNKSLEEIQIDQGSAEDIANQVGINAETGINLSSNQAELYVLDKDAFEFALTSNGLSLPDGVALLEVDQFSSLEADIDGGLPLSTCTTGFTVQNAAGTKGVLTAAHCGNTQRFDGTVLPFVSERRSGSADIQWHTIGSLTPRNRVRTCTLFGFSCGSREITGTVTRTSQTVGTYVCKYGKTTGKTCGYITTNSYRSAAVPSANATFVRVSKAGTDLSSGGDSGGPWYSGNNAYGTHVSGIGDDSVYMPINYISILGVSVLTR